MKKNMSLFIFLLLVLITSTSCNKDPMEIPDYPLNKQTVETALKKVDLPCVVSDETLDRENRTSISLRDEDGRLIAGIASEVDEENDWRFIGFSLVGYLMQGEASVYLDEDQWEDILGLGVVLYGGFTDQDIVYKDFIKNFEKESLVTELEAADETSYIKAYEWIKNYGDIYCSIIVQETGDGHREISNFKFYNSPKISNTNSELKAIVLLNTLFSGYGLESKDAEFKEDLLVENYLNNYSHHYTESCLENVKSSGLITFIDKLAYESKANIILTDIDLEDVSDNESYKDSPKTYNFTVALEVKDGKSKKEVTAQGIISVEHTLNGWHASEINITDSNLLEQDILGK